MKANISDISIDQDSTIKDVMRTIDKNGIGMALITENNKLTGLVTDGDIRRAIIEGNDINIKVKDIMNKEPVTITNIDINNKDIINLLMEKIEKEGGRFIPIVDQNKYVLELVHYDDLKNLKEPETKLEKGNRGLKKVLVVGGAGYLGSVLVRRLLEKGYKVRILDIFMFGEDSVKELLTNKDFEIVKGDIRDIGVISSALKGVDAVINLAAVVGDPACKIEPESTIETNYLATKTLAEACKYHQINRFVFASTASVYGIKEGLVNEASTPNPVSLYARSKLKSEEGILSLADENFSPCILRMATLYGLSHRMRFDLVVNVLTMKAVTEKKITIFGGKQWRPLLHVADAAESFLRCIEAPIEKIKGQIFNVGSNEQNHQIYELGNFIKEMIPDVEIETIEKDPDLRDYHVDGTKISKILGYKVKFNVKDAITEIKEALKTGKIKDPKNKIYYNS